MALKGFFLGAVTLLAFLNGAIAAIFFQFGPVSIGQVTSVIRTKLGPEQIDLAASVNLAFFVSISVLANTILLLILKYRTRHDVLLSGTLQSALILILINQAIIVPNESENQNTPEAMTMEEDQRGGSVVHLFIESLGPRASPPFGSEDANLAFLPDSGLPEFGTIRLFDGHNNTIMGLASSWCGTRFPSLEFSDSASTKFGMSDTECVHDNGAFVNHQKEFYGGYFSSFQSKEAYFQSKGITDYDLSFWKVLEPDELTSWGGGLNDKALLRNFLSGIEWRISLGQPFYATALTLDSHDGTERPIYCELVETTGNSSVDSLKCVGGETKTFLSGLRAQSFGKAPILVVIQGDHNLRYENETKGKAEAFFWGACLRDGVLDTPENSPPQHFRDIASWITRESLACSE